MDDVKKKAKALARKLKEKLKEREGHVKIDNVEAVHKLKPKKVKEDKVEEHPTKKTPGSATAVGPKGGVYKITASGKRKYGIKKSLEDLIQEDSEII